MKKALRFFSFLLILTSLYCLLSCDQLTESITQVNYIVPIWKGSIATAPENPEVGWAYYNTTLRKSFIYDGSDWQEISQDGSEGMSGNNSDEGKSSESLDTLVYIGESTETVDGIFYTVKSYAEIIGHSPYFYTYYKYYYLNNKLRKIYIFSHGLGCNLDYKYTEFVEHNCGTRELLSYIYSYYEDGQLESYIIKQTAQRSEYYYLQNGNKKSIYVYDKNNQLTTFILYYDSASNNQKLSVIYSSDGNLSSFIYYYPSGNTKYGYFYSSGSSLITYEDGETTGTISNYSQEQAKAKLEELMSE